MFGLAFFENNANGAQGCHHGRRDPVYETIASGEYPVSRPLFIYVKKAHFGEVPGLKEFAEFFVSDQVAGPGGPLAAYGLVSVSRSCRDPGADRQRGDDGRGDVIAGSIGALL